MIYTDTRDNSVKTNFRTAVMSGMNSATGGLYIPVEFPKLDSSFINKNPEPSFRDISFNMAKPYVDGEIPDEDLIPEDSVVSEGAEAAADVALPEAGKQNFS